MKEIKVIAKTFKGRVAIEQHVHESITTKKKDKLMFRLMGYRQEVIKTEPYTLLIQLKNKVYQNLVKCKDVENLINDTLNKNGAKKDRDYYFNSVE